MVWTVSGIGEASALSREAWLDLAPNEIIGGMPRGGKLLEDATGSAPAVGT